MGALRVLAALAMLQAALGSPLLRSYVESPFEERTDVFYRLPKHIVPSEYHIRLTPYLNDGTANNFTFKGTASIKFMTTVNDTKEIIIHSKDLSHRTGFNIVGNNTTITNISLNSIEKYDFLNLTIMSGETLSPGIEYTLNFAEFTGKLRDDMTGFYRSSYPQGNTTKWMATTQFQPVHARKAFPCFDEPGFKAVFHVIIDCPANLTCLSNSRVLNVNTTTNVHTFHPTPRMSTYLLAFVVSEFVKTGNGTDMGIWSRPEAKPQAMYAYKVANDVTEDLSKYTNISYWSQHSNGSLTMKMDHVAIPDFSAGAMENWGLITYREAYLMVDETHTTTMAKQRVAGIEAHEVAHMWFGNLVTCHWWSDTWLNEGFASFFQYFSTHSILPSFGMNSQFIVAQLQLALNADTSLASKPLTNNDVNSPEEISGHFGTISYQKGASIIRMIEHWVGSSTFKKGLNLHLNNRKHETVNPDHLFAALQTAADMDNVTAQYQTNVTEVFKSWTSKSGYPVITVWINHTSHSASASQERFVKEGETPNNAIYMIPITFATQSNPNFNNTKPVRIMKAKMESLGPLDHEWMILNVQQTGFYRVHYSDEIYGYINKYMKTNNWDKIHEYNRAQLIDDAFSFAMEGRMNYSFVMDIIDFLEKDKSYTPWAAAYAKINPLRTSFMHFDELSNHFDMHIRNLMATVVKDLGFFTNGTDLTKIFRTNTLSLACDLKHEECLSVSISLFRDWADKNTVIPADHREFVYCNGLRSGTGADFDKLWNKYITDNLVNEKILILNALGCTRNQTKIKNFLAETLREPSQIRSQDLMTAFNSAVRGNKENVPTVWDFFIQNIADIRRIYGKPNVRSMMNTIVNRMNENHQDWFASYVNGVNQLEADERESGKRSYEAAMKTREWVSSKQDDILTWIEAKYYSSAANVGASMLALFVALVLALFNH